MNRLDAVTSGSDYPFADKIMSPRVSRSVFSLNHKNTMTVPPSGIGSVIPVWNERMLPGDSFDISCDALMRVMPLVVPPYSGMKLYIHVGYLSDDDMWNAATVYHRRGMSGNEKLTKPALTRKLFPEMADSTALITSDHILHYIYHLPIGTKVSDYEGKIDAMPYFGYLKFCRDLMLQPNFHIGDKEIYPDDDCDFRLNSDGEIISMSGEAGIPSGFPVNDKGFFYRDHADDRFVSSMPSPMRGDPPVLDLRLDFSDSDHLPLQWYRSRPNGSLDHGDIVSSFYYDSSSEMVDSYKGLDFGYEGTDSFDFSVSHSREPTLNWHTMSKDNVGYIGLFEFTKGVDPTSLLASGTITQADLRSLAISTAELERMARTDGSYREFMQTFFGVVPKSALDRRTQYCGGTWQRVAFTEVVQTSASTESSHLGQYAGHGISQQSSRLGSVRSDDYGWCFVFASVVPDTIYSQGLDKRYTILTQDQEFLPDRAGLGAQPVLNSEIYFQGTEDDVGLFAYQDIYDEFRYQHNRVHGKMADPSSETFFPYTQSRYFVTLPTFSQSWASTLGNVRMDMFAGGDEECPLTIDFDFTIRAVRPLPFQSIPKEIV